MPPNGNLIPALALSLVLHGLIFWPAALRQPDATASAPLVATLRLPERASLLTPAPKPLSAPRRTASEDRAEPPRERLQLPESPPRAPEAAAAGLPRVITRNSTEEMPQRSDGGAVRQPHAAVVAVAAPLAVGAAAEGGLDPEGVRQYRMALATEMRRFKRYPARAMEANLVGTVEVRVSVAAAGALQEVALAHSSGHESLDDAALDMLRSAAPRTAVPERVRGRSFAVSLPVIFGLEDE